MPDIPYDDLDPWHSWANLVFGFMCKRCGVEIKLDWPDADGDEDFGRACVEVSTRAQSAGWIRVGSAEFLCPRCAGRESPAE